ncbi:MAG: hypothetical protein R3E45_01825 [Rhodocyclaceae bacterium]
MAPTPRLRFTATESWSLRTCRDDTKTFVTVPRSSTTRQALPSAGYHQAWPAISAHQGAEEELRLTLFERTPKGMQLTLAGEQLLERGATRSPRP